MATVADPKVVIRDPVGDNLITPKNSALLVIDYQPSQVSAVRSMDRDLLLKNVVSTAKLANLFGLPIVHSTINVRTGRGQPTLPPLAEVLADNTPIDRTSTNAWEDPDFLSAVRATGAAQAHHLRSLGQRRGGLPLSGRAFTAISHYFYMDVYSLWTDLALGFLIAGALAAWVPDSWWRALFLTGNPIAKVSGPLIGPIVLHSDEVERDPVTWALPPRTRADGPRTSRRRCARGGPAPARRRRSRTRTGPAGRAGRSR